MEWHPIIDGNMEEEYRKQELEYSRSLMEEENEE